MYEAPVSLYCPGKHKVCVVPPRMRNAPKLKIRRDQKKQHACRLVVAGYFKSMLGRDSGKGSMKSVSDTHQSSRTEEIIKLVLKT